MSSNSNFNLGRVMAEFQKRTEGAVFCQVHDGKVLTPTIAKIVAVFNSIDRHQDDLFRTVARAMDNLAVPIEGSFRPVASAQQPTLVGFVRANREVRDADDLKSYKTMAANILMDSGDKTLWELRSTGEGKRFLTRHATEDLSELLVTASVTTRGVPSIRTIASSTADREYLTYVCAKTEAVDHGYVLASTKESLTVLSRSTGEEVEVGWDFIVQSSGLKNADVDYCKSKGKELSAPASSDKQAMKEYYAKVYGYGPEFLAELDRIIDSTANI